MARVLYVDDNPLDRELAAWALRRLSTPPGPIELVCARSWDEGRPLLAAGDFDLLLLDLHLPGSTGLEIVRTELAPGHPRVIIVSGKADADTEAAALRAGAHGFVDKGMDWGEALLVAVRSALEPRS